MTNHPHAPPHWVSIVGTYFLTGATYQKEHFFNDPQKLIFLQNKLFELSEKFGWTLHAWAIFSNHYHFFANSPTNPQNLSKFLQQLHGETAIYLNRLDNTPGRKVWYQFWDTLINYERSYYARLNYVIQNPVKHGLVDDARNYPWCSASWFEENAPSAFVKTVKSFKCDKLIIYDDF